MGEKSQQFSFSGRGFSFARDGQIVWYWYDNKYEE
jgi:hypothetical protein